MSLSDIASVLEPDDFRNLQKPQMEADGDDWFVSVSVFVFLPRS